MRCPLHPAKSTQKSYVSLKMPRQVAALITYVQGIIVALTNNAHFVTPVPSLSLIVAAVAALQQAEVAVQARTKGSVVARNDRKAALVTLLHQLRGYIQTTADADPENGAAIIQSSGLPARQVSPHKARVFTVKPGPISGSAEVLAPQAARRASYDWQTSIDGGKTWIDAGPSLQAKRTITGLPVGSTVLFRYREIGRAHV